MVKLMHINEIANPYNDGIFARSVQSADMHFNRFCLKTISDGTLPQIIETTMDKLKPEAAYFHASDGQRSCFMVFDLKAPSEIPGIAEPFFMNLHAKVELCPVMNAEDLKKGLAVIMKK